MAIDLSDLTARLDEALAASVATGFPTIGVVQWPTRSNAYPYIRYRVADASESDIALEDEYYTQAIEVQIIVGEAAQEYSGLDLATTDIIAIMSEYRQYWQSMNNRQLITSTYTTRPTWLQGRGCWILRHGGQVFFGPPTGPAPQLYGIQYFLGIPMQETNIT